MPEASRRQWPAWAPAASAAGAYLLAALLWVATGFGALPRWLDLVLGLLLAGGAAALAHRLASARTGGAPEAPSLDMFDAILHSPSALTVWVKDLEGRYITVNRRFEELFGLRASDAVGRRDAELFPPPVAATYERTDREVLAAGEPRELEEVLTTEGGQQTFLAVRFPLRDKTGKPVALCGVALEITERKHMEEALRESEDRFRDVAEASSDWIWEMDESFRFTYLSERFHGLTGISPEEVIGRTRWELAAGDPDQDKWRRHRRVLEQHLAFRDFIYRHQATGERSGGGRYFKISGKPIHDASGRFRGYRGTGTDITDQVAAQQALEESQRTLTTLMGNLPGMAYRCRNDRDWTMEFVSPGSYRLLGYHPDQLIGNRAVSYGGLVHPEDQGRRWDKVQAALFEQRPYRVTYRLRTATGEQRWVWEQGCGVFSSDGELLALEGLVLDVTERRQAENERRRIRLYLKNIIDSMPSLLVGVDPEGRVTEWNQAAEAASGVARDDARDRPFWELLPALAPQREPVQRAIREGRSIKTAGVAMVADGETRYADVMVYPLASDEVSGAVIRQDDVTARVRMQEMMVQTEKMLSVGGLAAGMAHEINNPLGTVLQGCQNVLRRLSPELAKNREVAESLGLDLERVGEYLREREVATLIEGVRDAGNRAAKIVADMLAFSRQTGVQFAPVRVDELLDTAVRLAASDYDLKKRYDFKQIDIVRDFDASLDTVRCDSTEIEQVLLNLLKNAAQAMHKAGTERPSITLRTRREPHYASIEVIDNGPGMDEKTRKRVFEPFFTTKEVGAGTGLGLSVSYFIVTEQHKGTLTVSSAPRCGARFVIRLPLGA